MRLQPEWFIEKFLENDMGKEIPNDIFFSWVEEELAAGKSVRITVKGFSMMPLLRNGKDDVVLCSCNAQEVEVGDIVLFKYRGVHVLHRVLSIREHSVEGGSSREFVLRGDNIWRRREMCYSEDIVGKVVAIYRSGTAGKSVKIKSTLYSMVLLLWRIKVILSNLYSRSMRSC